MDKNQQQLAMIYLSLLYVTVLQTEGKDTDPVIELSDNDVMSYSLKDIGTFINEVQTGGES